MKLTTCLAVVCLSTAGVAAVTGAPPAVVSPGPGPGHPPVDAKFVERMLQSGRPELTSYVARRVLSAATWGGRMEARLEAWTYLDPDGTFRFDIIGREGSGLIRDHVLVAALKTEQRSRDPRQAAASALTPANYDFEIGGPGPEGLMAVRLLPRRKSPMLIEGSVMARQDSGDLVRVAGRLSELPSPWTTRVDVVRRYARIHGVRVPIEMASTAEVRIAGASSFSMTYHYTMINGQPVEPVSNYAGTR